MLGGPVGILCCCLPSQPPPSTPTPCGGHLKLFARVRWEEDRGPKPGASAPHLSTPLLSFLGSLSQNAPLLPHHFLHLSTQCPHVKDCERELLSPPLQPGGAKLWSPRAPPKRVCGAPVMPPGPWPRICATFSSTAAVLAKPAQPRAQHGAAAPGGLPSAQLQGHRPCLQPGLALSFPQLCPLAFASHLSPSTPDQVLTPHCFC